MGISLKVSLRMSVLHYCYLGRQWVVGDEKGGAEPRQRQQGNAAPVQGFLQRLDAAITQGADRLAWRRKTVDRATFLIAHSSPPSRRSAAEKDGTGNICRCSGCRRRPKASS